MSKNCAQHVRGQWARSGVVIHHSPTSLWNTVRAAVLSTGPSPTSSHVRTQIVHMLADKNNRSNSELSAVSTQPITTTTT